MFDHHVRKPSGFLLVLSMIVENPKSSQVFICLHLQNKFRQASVRQRGIFSPGHPRDAATRAPDDAQKTYPLGRFSSLGLGKPMNAQFFFVWGFICLKDTPTQWCPFDSRT